MKWLDKIPLPILAVIAIMMAVAPIAQQPHLIEKIIMLSQFTLSKPIDIFDLFLHATPITLLIIKLVRMWKMSSQKH